MLKATRQSRLCFGATNLAPTEPVDKVAQLFELVKQHNVPATLSSSQKRNKRTLTALVFHASGSSAEQICVFLDIAARYERPVIFSDQCSSQILG